MDDKKYEKNIITDLSTEKDDIGTLLFRLDEKAINNIPFFTAAAWVWPKSDKIIMEDKSHSHQFEEAVTLFGTNPENPKDLCGEVEFWFDDEKYTITKSCIIYIPKGVKHCPLIFHRVDKPIFHYTVGHGGHHSKE